jgi:acetyl esterase/lipase
VPTNDYRSYVTVVHPDRFDLDFARFYEWANEQTPQVRESVRHVLDLAYGDDPKQQLDIYLPDGPLENAPVLLHMHGGGFVEGDRVDYAFLAPTLTKQGIILVLPSYRLCSDGHTMLDAVADTKAAIKWVHDTIARYGGNDKSIVLSGHSAGAIMSSNAIVDLAWMDALGIPASFIRAAIMISGVYNFPLDFNARNDILTSPEVKIAMSAMQHIGKMPGKMVLAVGSIETGPKDDYLTSAHAFRDALETAGADVQLLVLPEQNHIEMSCVVGEEGSPVFEAVMGLLR